MLRNVSLVFVNTDETFDIARSYSQKFVYVGMLGAQDSENETLPKKLNEYFNKGKSGSIFVSFGTVTPFLALTQRVQQSVYNAIQKLPNHHFVIKTALDDSNTAELFADVSNVDLVDWVPQTAILNHPNLKMFVSHGGQNSVLETMYHGIPMVIMPVFTDQFRNGKNVERRGAGKMVLRHLVVNGTFFDVMNELHEKCETSIKVDEKSSVHFRGTSNKMDRFRTSP
ncbi:hypothetical protein B9Z55_025042 [Caenorhabditis nigoni]|nr:hypothetical protein B9Z55_025042 [Caenorhabditis nigoni]